VSGAKSTVRMFTTSAGDVPHTRVVSLVQSFTARSRFFTRRPHRAFLIIEGSVEQFTALKPHSTAKIDVAETDWSDATVTR
jgi:hypothetical protein